MDNFRKFKAPHKSSRGAAVDGMIGATRGSRQTTTRRSTIGEFKKPTVTRVDSFKGTDGFRPNSQSKLQSSRATTVAATPAPKTAPGFKDGKMKLDLPEAAAKKQSSKRAKFKKGALISVLIVFLAGGVFFGNAFLKTRKIFGGGGGAPALEANVDPTKLNGEGDGRVNILMLGKGGPGHEAPDLTDTLIIASIDPIQKEASLLSVPRDFWVKTDAGSSKINAVYSNAKIVSLNQGNSTDTAEKAGLSAIESELENVLGIPIHYYVMVDFTAFEKAINTVGGVSINVPKSAEVYERLYDHSAGRQYVLDVKEGQNDFDGKRALFFARSRATSARGDFARSERQRLVLIALKDKITSAGTYGNPVKVNQLVNEFGDHVRSNLSTGEVLRVYDIMKGIDSASIGSVGLADLPNVMVATDNIGGQSVVVPKAGLYDYSEIQNFVRNTLRDGYLKKENASIAVFNGSTITGLAAKRADELKSFGYNITVVDNAPTKNYSQTTLVDLTGGQKKYTLNYLEKRLGVTASTSLPDGTINPNGAEFVIILGQNESTNQ